MKEIYWIQRLDGLCAFCEVLVILSTITAILAAVTFFVFWLNGDDESDDIFIRSSKRAFIISCITAVLFGSAAVFVPTSEEALIIYGVGGTVDYVQDSETLRKFGIVPFVQPYRDFENKRTPTQYEKDLARWANNKFLYKSCSFEDFEPRKGFKCKEYF